MARELTPFLMFTGKAGEAMNFYTSLFDDAHIVSITRYGPGEDGPEGSVFHATFELNGQRFMCIDSYVEHAFNFTPAISIHVECETEAEIDRLYGNLAEDGQIFMPLGAYPFSEKYGWVGDRFGVTWQLTLTRP